MQINNVSRLLAAFRLAESDSEISDSIRLTAEIRKLPKSMSSVEDKRRFSERLNAALDRVGAPPLGNGRQAFLQRKFKVSQQAAAKWLYAEAIPQTKRIPWMARELNVNGEWLLTGQGCMRDGDEPAGQQTEKNGNSNVFVIDGDEKALILKLRSLTGKEREAILNLLKIMSSTHNM